MTHACIAGDYTGLAKDYSQYRPDYSPLVLKAILGLLDKPIFDIDFVDVGGGTGIWTRMVNAVGVKSVTVVEPNEDMRRIGIADSEGSDILWLAGRAEKTGLSTASTDWISMASSFHWVNFDLATREFSRVLRPGGLFTALWNTRLIEGNPLLVEIEEHLNTYKPNIKRVSSGRSGITKTLTDRLLDSSHFKDIVYLEGRHSIEMTPDRYIGIWRSVSDIRVQLGPSNFDSFLSFIKERINGLKSIKTSYLTRAWSARCKA